MVSARQRELGQNFLVDRNLLDVIERLAELTADDVVLEVGGGQGVLSQRLAARAGHVHVIELDHKLRETLLGAVSEFDNVDVVFGDATSVDLASLTPAATAMIANLPYGVAATVILRTVFELPSIGRWVCMVQREVGERFAAAPGTSAYGVPSVLAQLSCDVRVLRAVSRNVFRPIPNVDSALVGLRRRPDAAPVSPDLRRLVAAAFAHRRKALAGSLALSGYGGGGSAIRDRARTAVTELGLPADVRAERLSAEQFRALAEALSA